LPKAQLLAAPALQTRFPSSLFKYQSNVPNLSFLREETEKELKDAQLVISCGGDGTLLHISSIFQNGPCPPVLPFSLGSLGFLSSFGKPNPKIIFIHFIRFS
jgi:NAD kinase